MAPMKQNNNYSSSNHYGEEVAASAHRQANILASCYLVDASAASLKGLHYCTTGVTGAECPPLAAITSTNQLALTPKAPSSRNHGRLAAEGNHNHASRQHRRGGATLRIREECERFFCEMLRAMFLGERNLASQRSGLAGVYYNNNHNNNHNNNNSNNYSISNGSNNSGTSFSSEDSMDLDHAGFCASAAANHGQLTPPDDYDSPIADKTLMVSYGVGVNRNGCSSGSHEVTDWLEIWDYAGGSSFRAFVAEDLVSAASGRSGGDDSSKSLFVFFDAHVLGRDLKQALVALIELADGPLTCSHMVICIDRSIPAEEAKALTKGLQWAGFSPTTLDFWSGGLDVVSDRWLFMGMEI